ncbi:MAG: Asp-tRNA(Asn)/Glu-tRNA(Gln) amidotransferase subunit GatC [Candidatus Nanoarchaeia archaeon]
MKVDKELILRVAKNARLSLSAKEVNEFVPQFKEILNYFSILDEVDVKNTEPSFQPIRLKNIFRKDSVGKCLSQDEALSNTAHKKDGFFKGPKAF